MENKCKKCTGNILEDGTGHQLYCPLRVSKYMNKEDNIKSQTITIVPSPRIDWCGACKAANPYVQKIVERLRFKFIKIEENEELEQEYGVDYYPHLILASKGKTKHYPGGNEIKSLYESII